MTRSNEEEVLMVVGADPMTAHEITEVLCPDMCESRKAEYQTNLYKTLDQLVSENRLEKIMATSPGGCRKATYSNPNNPGPSMKSVLDVLDSQLTSGKDITERLYGFSSDILMRRVRWVLGHLERERLVVQEPMHNAYGFYIQGWRLAA